MRDSDRESLAGVVLSHGHPDHYGLASELPNDVPLYMGAATVRILKEAAFFTPLGLDREPAGFLADRTPIELGPFKVTPFLADHSAFDAYSLLVEAAGRRLFYSGDLRAHGRKASLFQRLIDHPPEQIDVLLMEGTRITSTNEDERPETTEEDVEARCVELFGQTEGLVLLMFSIQNIDRLVSLYRAALRANRELVLDLYGAAVTKATSNPNIPQLGFDRVNFFVPQSQKLAVLRSREFERTAEIRASRVYPEQLPDRRHQLAMTFRPSMSADLERADCLAGARAIWSMWPGYLHEPRMQEFHDFRARHGIPLDVVHASGHATVADLKRLAQALAPGRIVPIHTAAPERFEQLFHRVEPHSDGEWWQV
ncbi:MAG: MBL fold metallo-hydrolase [Solirubrobacterales bacterium]